MDTQDAVLENLKIGDEEMISEMIETGVFYGKLKERTHPRMRQYILTNRGGIEIINLHFTLSAFYSALAFMEEKIKEGEIFLLVGTNPSARDVIEQIAKDLEFPYVNTRWIGGTLTNFKTALERINYFKNKRADFKAGKFDKYTKKERLMVEREIKKLEEKWGGLEKLEKLPSVLFVIDPVFHSIAVKEAYKLSIPVVALASTDANPDYIDYLIPGNCSARKSVEWLIMKMRPILIAAKEERDKKIILGKVKADEDKKDE